MPGQIRANGRLRGARRTAVLSMSTKMSPTCRDNFDRVKRGFIRRVIHGIALFGSVSVNVSENKGYKTYLKLGKTAGCDRSGGENA